MLKAYCETNRIDLLPLVNAIMTSYACELKKHAREKTRKIAWCSSAGPVELLRAMDFEVYFPEKHWELLGPTDTASDLDPVTPTHCKSPEFQSFLTADSIAKSSVRVKRHDFHGRSEMDVPEPDLLVFNTLQGSEVKQWLNWYARSLGKPVIGIDLPRNIGALTSADLKSVVLQLRNMILMLEAISGRKFDIDRLRAVTLSSRRCAELWQSCLKLSAYLPAPWSYFDHLQFIFPAVVLRGQECAIEFYERLFSELVKRVQQGEVTVRDEQIRLLWSGMPLWLEHSHLFSVLKSLKASVVASTSCNCWDLTALDETQPLISMARVYSGLFMGRDQDFQCAYLNRLVQEFRVDGLLLNGEPLNDQRPVQGFPALHRLSTDCGIPMLNISQVVDEQDCDRIAPAIPALERFIEHLSG